MIGVRNKPRGMFGAPLRSPIPPFNPQAQTPMGMPGLGMTQQMPAPEPEQQHRGPDGKLYALGGLLMNLGGIQNNAAGEYMARQQAERAARSNARAQAMARQAERMESREDKQWEWDNKPKEPRYNDTIEDFNWYKGLPAEDRAIYDQMKPQYRQGPDGQFYRIDTQQGAPAAPTVLGDTLPEGWKIQEDGTGNGPATFP